MRKVSSIEDYFENHFKWQNELVKLRSIVLKTEFTETLKWGVPTYTINKKNVLGIVAFKNYVGLWFFNGSFLQDTNKRLINVQEGKTKGMRQWRFHSIKEIDEKIILEYLHESIKNQKEGKEIKVSRNKPLNIPPELERLLLKNNDLKIKFNDFTKYKQRQFAEYIFSAKKDITKQVRVEKIVPMIISGIGLHDKYRSS